MAGVLYEIETLNTDNNRLNEIPIKIIIRNETQNKVKVLSIVPNISSSIELEEKQDVFQEDSKSQFEDLCTELSLIIDNIFLASSVEHRNILTKAMTDVYKEFYGNMPKLVLLLFLNKSSFDDRIKSFNIRLSKLRYKIKDVADAKWGYENWVKPLENGNPEKKLYEGKLQQLENLVTKIGEVNTKYIANIEPGSFYSRTYVLRFYRKPLSTKVYNISFDSIYFDETSEQEYRANTSTSINITPKPLSLTIFSAISAVLGTALKYCMTNINSVTVPKDFYIALGNTLITAPGFSAVITAILFFNIYEYTDMGKKIKIGINWRTALTIGILSGLLADRFIDALKILIGMN